MQCYLLYVFIAISKMARTMMIPMTMRAIMAPEPEADGQERAAVILIACFSVTASNLQISQIPVLHSLPHVSCGSLQ